MSLLLALALCLSAAEPRSGWVAKPDPAAAGKAASKSVRFCMDRLGGAWALSGGRLRRLGSKKSLKLPLFVDGVAYAGTAAPLVSGEGRLHAVMTVEAMHQDSSGSLILPLRPIRRLPPGKCRLSDGAAGDVYILCAEKSEHKLYLLRPGGGPLTLLLSSSKPIAAAAGDGTASYAAVGRSVLKLREGAFESVLTLEGPIRDLAHDGTRLYYATEGEAGWLEPSGPQSLGKFVRPQLQARQGVLYVFSEADWSVVAVSL
jgi:hypothetical protein